MNNSYSQPFNPYTLPSTQLLGMSQGDPYLSSYSSATDFPSPTPVIPNMTYSGSAFSVGPNEEIRTIFITGFPPDVKERELNNLLRFLPGYKASQMNWKNGQAQGFALFEDTVSARQSVDNISQLVFDENHVLRCEMAHKNMYVKEEALNPMVKKQRFVPALGDPQLGLMEQQVGYPGDFSLPMQLTSASSMGLAAPVPAPVRPAYGQVTNMRDNPPCNTLFVGNLSDNVDENDLRSLFQAQPGFRQMKLVHGDKGINCFVEFVDEQTATMVHRQQQGAILPSSDRGPIRIQFSKNPFGKKRERDGTDNLSLPSIMGSQNGMLATPYMSPSPRIDGMPFPQPGPHAFPQSSPLPSPQRSS
eukprot:TRINITY_DN8985_c0_g2_i1.p1 TRINITY_DN8985_c0_g2~~TRINITY_DN8985_c0_g2_i1.p1  ORF type:complete len:360 (+),score=40.43 TRINITY_DN8985_c0_g2_i1:316-1395(+)